jgi:RNA polymerase sigma-70 factor (ECF subfamily)
MAEGGEPESDETLAGRVQGGDREALESLVRRFLRPVHAVIASFLTEPSQVEDASQETFLRMLRAIDTYDTRRPFAPWLYQVARNAARNEIAKEGLRSTEPFPEDGPSAAGPPPDSAAEQSEIRTRVQRALEALPEQRRVAFRLVDVDGMGAAEAGRMMGISAGAVRAHVHHARRQLREALAEYANVTDDARDARHE